MQFALRGLSAECLETRRQQMASAILVLPNTERSRWAGENKMQRSLRERANRKPMQRINEEKKRNSAVNLDCLTLCD